MTSDTPPTSSVHRVSRSAAITLDEVGTGLVDAARTVLERDGAAGFTVRAIAAAAGTSTMAVYTRFGGKDGVVEQLWTQGFDLLAEAMHDAGTTDDPLADLQRCGQAYRRFALQHTTLYRVMFSDAVPDYVPSEPARQHAKGTLEALADKLARAMTAGLLHPIDPLRAAAMVWSTCHGVMSLELSHKDPIDWTGVFDDAVATLVRGMLA